MQDTRYGTFAEFFAFYLREHSAPANRSLHYLGTASAVLLLLLAFSVGPLWMVVLVGPVGYLPAWIGHFVIEKNRPATFKYPFWSLRADFVMLGLFLTGRLGDRLTTLHSDG